MEGTFTCPICGKDSIHQHSGEEIVAHRNGKVVPPDLRWTIGRTDYDGGRAFGREFTGVVDENGKQIAFLDTDTAKKIIDAHNSCLRGYTPKLPEWHGGDVAAGTFTFDGVRWIEVPRDSAGSTVLFHKAGWPSGATI